VVSLNVSGNQTRPATDSSSRIGSVLRLLHLYSFAIRVYLTLLAVVKVPSYARIFGFLRGIPLCFQLRARSFNGEEVVAAHLNADAPPLKLRSSTADINVFEQIFIRGQYRFQLSYEPKLIVDAGAHIGCATVYFALTYPHAVIIALEPEPRNFELLATNTAAYRNVVPLRAALWGKPSAMSIVDSGASTWAFRVREDAASQAAGILGLTMSEIIAWCGMVPVDLLKIDVEGAEKEIFAGDCSAWLDHVGTIMIETHDRITPGCSQALARAIADYNFIETRSGECHVLTRRHSDSALLYGVGCPAPAVAGAE
jgi:FkbM family methyltransferase